MNPKHCERCGTATNMKIMSMFNTEMICMPCKDAERKEPGYDRAVQAELDALRSGNYNFPGVGR